MRIQLAFQFWIGAVDSEIRFADFMGEDENFWSEENQDGDTVPLSPFIASQGGTWYDHDFLKAGSADKPGSVFEKFRYYSCAEQWASLIEAEMAAHSIPPINAFIMIGVDAAPNQRPYRQVENPCSCHQEGINLVYIGEITHDNSD